MNTNCIHSCKGLCNALEVAEHRELQAIREYKRFAEQCDYPDVRVMLEQLIRDRESSLKVLTETRMMLAAKFDVLDNITDSFV